jgi:hypothetical protein
MALNFTSDAADIKSHFGLNESQFTQLKNEVGKLSPNQRAAVSDEYVLLWKALNTGDSSAGSGPPPLTPANMGSYLSLAGWTGDAAFPSPGATMLSVLTEVSAEQRKDNREEYQQDAESIAATMKAQAGEIRSKAKLQLILGCVSGALAIAEGAASFGMSVSNLNKFSAGKITEAQLGARNTALQGAQGAVQGASGIINAVSQYYGQMSDAKIKEMDAVIELKRSDMEQLRSLDQSLTEVIQKALSSHEAIQQGVNQTMSRILG